MIQTLIDEFIGKCRVGYRPRYSNDPDPGQQPAESVAGPDLGDRATVIPYIIAVPSVTNRLRNRSSRSLLG
ncbi:MAG: hypothetical protein IH943_09230 [Acidobacteria bacterium]|nr:hypothetical protein [Acidobacteriota bacterium]